ncbi:fatty acid desaturase [Hyunsoonleella sp. SJ7]|uniref:Fatty acid desaturase n=1 Tax=Hyunsoonleella aquatilis TaxID=2762758 RepID=A0A923HGA3_9FLAO|nr:fatty acid desaturase [Hyunsoonleella aquatilis]MBC3759733.1 fatty acid desaturase [Hyunsoonleella aquatilis]
MKSTKSLYKAVDPYGIIIAFMMIFIWFFSLYTLLIWDISYANPLVYLAILLQTHLYTGLFITAHDAMHGSVSKNRKWNTLIGWITSMLFAFNFYDRLLVKHHEHHRFVASDKDPDFHESGKFWPWYWSFIKKYTTLKQLILMTISLQLLRLIFPLDNLLLFWILPGILSTFQLFYFGTYVPHKDGHDHDNKHHSSSLEKNHIWAFLSCYFFGYHYEHHDAPGVPWWRLWKVKQ